MSRLTQPIGGWNIVPTGNGHYETTVNKGSANMAHLTGALNKAWARGWRLAHVFEQKGNTVMVWESTIDRDPAPPAAP